MVRFLFQPLWCLLLALLLAFSSLNSKAMGLAWLLFVLTGAWVALQNQGRLSAISAQPWAKTWLLTASLALLIKSIATFYWTDPWSERHGELRLFLGALALYGFLDSKDMKRNTLSMIALSMTISSAVGLAWVIFYGRDAVPTHPIPLAGSMAMVSAFLLALSYHLDFSRLQRRLWFFGGTLALLAVLSSQSRGAYGIAFWWLAVGLYHLWRRQPCLHASRSFRSSTSGQWALLGAILIGLAALSQTPVFQRPVKSTQDAINEIRISQESREAGSNSSVGARLYMWQKSLTAIEESPWIGHGHDARKKFLLEWAEAAQSAEIKRLGHVHNEYLHQLIDHGLWGLSSQIFYLVAWVIIVWQLLKKNHHVSALSVAGMAFIHMTTSLTNVNFAHNYYTASLSLFIGLSLWLTRLEPQGFGKEKSSVQQPKCS
jgi:O-antigen ligase